MTTLTDRSRSISYGTCERMRFLNYHALGTGIVPNKLNINLSTGLTIHNGVSELFSNGGDIEKAIEYTLNKYSTEVEAKEINLDPYENQLFVFQEQKALIEALLRVYYLIQYPKIISEYEILAVEKEINWDLIENTTKECEKCTFIGMKFIKAGDPVCFSCSVTGKINNNEGITFMSRPDAILRDKSTGGLVIYSLKTSSTWNDTNEKQNKYDDQGISELIAVEKCLNEEVEAIKMDFLIKGQRQLLLDQNSLEKQKIKLQNTYLIHPYLLETPFNVQYSLKYTKAKGYRRVNIWEEMEIKDWIQMLYENDYDYITGNGEDKNTRVIVTPYPYVRSLEDIEDWLEQARFQEQQIDSYLQHLKALNNNTLVGSRESTAIYKQKLNEYFPKRRNQCYQYGGFCSYVDICWGGLKTTSIEYTARTPHHELELELYKIEKK